MTKYIILFLLITIFPIDKTDSIKTKKIYIASYVEVKNVSKIQNTQCKILTIDEKIDLQLSQQIYKLDSLIKIKKLK